MSHAESRHDAERYIYGLSQIAWIISDFRPKPVNKYHTGQWAGCSDPLLATSQHAICLSQVNIHSYEHSSHTDTPLQNTLPTMPFSKHLCLLPNRAMSFHSTHSLYFRCFNEKAIALREESSVQFPSGDIYIMIDLGGGLVNSNEKPCKSAIFHFAGLISVGLYSFGKTSDIYLSCIQYYQLIKPLAASRCLTACK